MSDNESNTTNLSMEEEVTTSKVKSHKKMILLVLLVTLLLLLAIILGVLIIIAHISANATRESIKSKTMKALKTAPNGTTLGRPIWLKISNASCLLFSNTEGHFYATKTSSNLDYCLDIGKRWAMDERGLYYWEDVWGSKQEDFCQIKRSGSHLCYRKSPIRFTITEHRVEFKKKKVFFTIQSLAEPGLCLTLCPRCPTKNIQLVTLDHCNASPEQLFTLNIADYKEDFVNLKYSSLVYFFGL